MESYIEIIDKDTGEAVETVDVSGRSGRDAHKVQRGMNINLNHDRYYTRLVDDSRPKEKQ